MYEYLSDAVHDASKKEKCLKEFHIVNMNGIQYRIPCQYKFPDPSIYLNPHQNLPSPSCS